MSHCWGGNFPDLNTVGLHKVWQELDEASNPKGNND